jgi:hypothetical protein
VVVVVVVGATVVVVVVVEQHSPVLTSIPLASLKTGNLLSIQAKYGESPTLIVVTIEVSQSINVKLAVSKIVPYSSCIVQGHIVVVVVVVVLDVVVVDVVEQQFCN